MAQFANPRKSFNFTIEIEGIEAASVQKITHPEAEIDRTPHGDTNYDVYTPGRRKTSVATLEKLKKADGIDNVFWDWLTTAQNDETGSGLLPSVVKKLVVVRELTPMRTIAASWQWVGAWPTKVSESDNDRESSDNSKEIVELSVDRKVKF